MFEDTKGPIRTTYDIYVFFNLTTEKTTDLTTRIPIKTEVELRCSGSVSSTCSTRDNRRATARGVLVVPVPHVTPVVLMLNYTDII